MLASEKCKEPVDIAMDFPRPLHHDACRLLTRSRTCNQPLLYNPETASSPKIIWRHCQMILTLVAFVIDLVTHKLGVRKTSRMGQ